MAGTLLESDIPDVDSLIAMQPEELAPFVLRHAHSVLQGDTFSNGSLMQRTAGLGTATTNGPLYDGKRREEVLDAIGEALQWLLSNGLAMPSPDSQDFMQITRRGRELVDRGKFDAYRAAALFPKQLLHPSIADKVHLALVRGDLGEAVLAASKAVEVAVREAGGYGPDDIGVALMRKAFDPENGPLTKPDDPLAERQALAHLFAGAIGSYKNPHSHRTVDINDRAEAQEIVMLASHLLRIVDARRARARAQRTVAEAAAGIPALTASPGRR